MNGAYEDNIPFLASALTFDALLWILPFTLIALSIFGYVVHTGGDTLANIQTIFDRFLPAQTGGPADPFATAEQALARVVESRAELSLYGIPLFVWFSFRLFGSMRAALNDVFDTDENRSYFLGKGLDAGLGVITALFITLNTAVEVVVVQAPWFGRFLAALTAFAFGVVLFFILYTLAPSRRVRWDTALVAAVFMALAFEVAKRLYALYLANFTNLERFISNANALAAVLFVLWVYYTAYVFLVGGEVAETYDLARRQREQRALLA